MRRKIETLFSQDLFILILIFFLALALRLIQLESLPSGLFRDEIISGYVGRFILMNGRDLYGNIFPLLYFDKYGDFPPVLPMYLSGLGTFLFGFNVFALHMPVALVGSFLIFPIHYLAKWFFQKRAVGLLAAFFVAILPWHIELSRTTAEGIVALTVAVSALTLMLFSLLKKKNKLVIISFILLLGTYLLYPSYRILVPFLLLPLPFLFWKERKTSNILLLFVGISILLTICIATTTWGRARFEQTSLFGKFNNAPILSRLHNFATEDGPNNVRLVRIFHNKPIVYLREFISQYASYFSLRYLFLEGGLPYRYATEDQGLLFEIFAVFLCLSFLYLYKISRDKRLYLLYLLVISPFPSPITTDDVPNVHRSLFMILPLMLLVAYGCYMGITSIRYLFLRKSIVGIISVLLLLEFVYFAHQYINHVASVKSVTHGDMNKEYIATIIQERKNYDHIILPVHDAMPIYYLYYAHNFNPQIIGRFAQGKLGIKQIDNLSFTEDYCTTTSLDKKGQKPLKNTLIVDDGECRITGSFQMVKRFYRHDGTESYRLYAYK